MAEQTDSAATPEAGRPVPVTARTDPAGRAEIRTAQVRAFERPAPGAHGEPPPESERPAAAVIRDALGVGVAVGLSGFAFGVTSAGAGLSLWQSCALSLLVFTGASQFALVGALAAGGNPYTAAAGAFFLGVRNAFYGLRLSAVLGYRGAARPLAAHWVIDETTAVTLAQPGRRSARLGFTVTGLSLYVLWNLTTLAGALGARALGDTAAWGLDAAGPAVFVALLAPMLRTAVERCTAGLAVLLLMVTLPVLPAGVPVLLSALAAPAVLAFQGRRRTSAARETTPAGPSSQERADADRGTPGEDRA
ncbi:AzlC family ABC transporter permease [Streptomyces sp. NPDC020883]|uniref:AzlC family ABC transporter permease n=1 Tax=Streptomyces sp. NPDC020883 TaxID=3365099 RepID=UPI0037B56EBC